MDYGLYSAKRCSRCGAMVPTRLLSMAGECQQCEEQAIDEEREDMSESPFIDEPKEPPVVYDTSAIIQERNENMLLKASIRQLLNYVAHSLNCQMQPGFRFTNTCSCGLQEVIQRAEGLL